METQVTKQSAAARFTANIPLVIIFLLLVDSLHFVFARLLLPYLHPLTSAFFVMGMATVETAVYLGIRGVIRPAIVWQHRRFFAAVGFLVAAATSLSYSAVRFIDPGTASLLAQTSILFALGLSILWLGDRLMRQEVVGAIIAVIGVFVISFQVGGGSNVLWGSLLVLAAAFIYALHTAVVKRFGGGIEFANFFMFRVASTAFFLLLFTMGEGRLVLPPREAWVYLWLAATFDVVISRILYYLVLRRLQMSHHAIILTLSPVVAIAWSYALFGVAPSIQSLAGGAGVLFGVMMVSLGRRRAMIKAGEPAADARGG